MHFHNERTSHSDYSLIVSATKTTRIAIPTFPCPRCGVSSFARPFSKLNFSAAFFRKSRRMSDVERDDLFRLCINSGMNSFRVVPQQKQATITINKCRLSVCFDVEPGSSFKYLSQQSEIKTDTLDN